MLLMNYNKMNNRPSLLIKFLVARESGIIYFWLRTCYNHPSNEKYI